MTRRMLPLLLLLAPFGAAHAQNEGGISTQMLVRAESKEGVLPTATAIKLELNDKVSAITSLTPVNPANAQVALLIDDGLSRSAGIQLNDLKAFATSLPQTTELMVGYMANGTVRIAAPFSTDHAAAAEAIRLPLGVPGESASPYFCLSEFAKHWPSQEPGFEGAPRTRKARFVLMITNGVDPYNGSTSVLNQDSPYVQTAIADAQRAGAAVSSIYYRDAGYRGGSAAFSGQSYLEQVADATGGYSYYQGTITPPSLSLYLKQFTHDISETYVATFLADPQAGGRSQLVRVKMKSEGPKLKLRHPDAVRPGNLESTVAASLGS